jgi:hypothetical protein
VIKEKKMPWNPFPLASLRVEGLTACAKSVLIYLAARSNHKGETCVGHRTIQRELVRSKDFVTSGLKELYVRDLVKASSRGRRAKEADWKTISPSVLTSGTTSASNPAQQDYKEELQSCSAGLISPARQDYTKNCSPAQQGKTLQIESLDPNLTDETNLAGSSVLQSFSQGTSAPLAEDQETDKDKTLQGLEPTKRKTVEALSERLGQRNDIPAALGIPYFHSGHDLIRISVALHDRNRSEVWLAQLVHWAKGITDPKDSEAMFWKRRLQTGDKAVAKLAEFLETGTIAEQYDARLHARRAGCLNAVRGERNDLLLRDGVWIEEYHNSEEGKAFAASVPKSAPKVLGFFDEEKE